MSCTVLLAAFSGLLRQQQLEPKPIQWVDSFEQLLDEQWKHLDVKISTLSHLHDFSLRNPQLDLIKRLKKNGLNIIQNEQDAPARYKGMLPSCDSIKNELDKVKNGSVAIIHQYTILRFCLIDLISDDFKEDIDFHISRQSFHPLFTHTNPKLMNKTFEGVLSLV